MDISKWKKLIPKMLFVCRTCKMDFEIQDCFMDIWEWISQQLKCNLNFENAFENLEVQL